MNNSLVVSNVVATIECGLSCGEGEEEDNDEFNYRRDKVGFEQKMLPWGNLETCKDSDFERDGLNQLKVVVSQEKVMLNLNIDNVHFLEETDEAKLSKRVLALSRTNRVRSALELFRSLELSSLHPDLHACNSLLSCLLRNGLLDDGLRVFEFMKTEKITTGHKYSLVLKSVADVKDCDVALRMFSEMERECRVKNGFDVVVYNTMILVCGRVNDWPETLRLWRSMKENGHTGTRITCCLLVAFLLDVVKMIWLLMHRVKCSEASLNQGGIQCKQLLVRVQKREMGFCFKHFSEYVEEGAQAKRYCM